MSRSVVRQSLTYGTVKSDSDVTGILTVIGDPAIEPGTELTHLVIDTSGREFSNIVGTITSVEPESRYKNPTHDP